MSPQSRVPDFWEVSAEQLARRLLLVVARSFAPEDLRALLALDGGEVAPYVINESAKAMMVHLLEHDQLLRSPREYWRSPSEG